MSSPGTRWRGPALLGLLGLLLCLSIDFTNPLLPGSQQFDPSQSVDGVHVTRARGPAGPALLVARPLPSPRLREAAVSAPDRPPARAPIRAPALHRPLRPPARLAGDRRPDDDH